MWNCLTFKIFAVFESSTLDFPPSSPLAPSTPLVYSQKQDLNKNSKRRRQINHLTNFFLLLWLDTKKFCFVPFKSLSPFSFSGCVEQKRDSTCFAVGIVSNGLRWTCFIQMISREFLRHDESGRFAFLDNSKRFMDIAKSYDCLCSVQFAW